MPQQFIVTQGPVTVQQQQQSFVGHIILSCFVSWCCCCPLGLTAFILALVAQSSSLNSYAEGHRFGRFSIGFSIAGIIVGVIISIICVVVYVLLFLQIYEQTSNMIDKIMECPYRREGTCYMERDEIGVGMSCINGLKRGNYCYHNGTSV
jgi:threonine/homoserine/homoserine lactone efflux protein